MADRMKAAMVYAAKLQWAVLPLHSIKAGKCTCGRVECSSPGKHPLICNGVRGATKDPRVIKQWWYRWPFANVGIAAGRPSGFFVVDVDGAPGADSLWELEAEHGKLPDTIEQVTGSGGRHLLFKHPDKLAVPNKVGLRPGLDIRGMAGISWWRPASMRAGGCTLGRSPPSLWRLRWPTRRPGYWSLFQEKKRPRPKLWTGRGLISEICEGARNETLTRYAGRLLARGIGGKETLYLILALNARACKPPLPDEEVITIVSSICRKELQKMEVKHYG